MLPIPLACSKLYSMWYQVEGRALLLGFTIHKTCHAKHFKDFHVHTVFRWPLRAVTVAILASQMSRNFL